MGSRKEQKEALRAERLERERKAARAVARKRFVGIVVAGILALAIVGALAAVLLVSGDGDGVGVGSGPTVSYPDGAEAPPSGEADLARAARAAGCSAKDFEEEGSGHTTGSVNYKSNPPNSGQHNPVPAEDDIYQRQPPLENLVHALEHGRVIFWVRPDARPAVLGQLKAVYDEDPYHVLAVPKADLPTPLAASAWTHTLTCPKADDAAWAAMRAFKERYRDKGPEFVP